MTLLLCLLSSIGKMIGGTKVKVCVGNLEGIESSNKQKLKQVKKLVPIFENLMLLLSKFLDGKVDYLPTSIL